MINWDHQEVDKNVVYDQLVDTFGSYDRKFFEECIERHPDSFRSFYDFFDYEYEAHVERLREGSFGYSDPSDPEDAEYEAECAEWWAKSQGLLDD